MCVCVKYSWVNVGLTIFQPANPSRFVYSLASLMLPYFGAGDVLQGFKHAVDCILKGSQGTIVQQQHALNTISSSLQIMNIQSLAVVDTHNESGALRNVEAAQVEVLNSYS